MYTTQKAKYKFATLNKTLERFINIKQEDNKSILDYTKKFKQVKDITQKSWEMIYWMNLSKELTGTKMSQIEQNRMTY